MEKEVKLMDSKHRKGYLCELIAEKYFTDKGLHVFKNSSGLGPVDLITYNDETKKIRLIDVKYESKRLTGKKAGTRINRIKIHTSEAQSCLDNMEDESIDCFALSKSFSAF